MSKKGKSTYERWEKAIKEYDLKAISNLISEYPNLVNQGIIHYRKNGTTFQTLPLNMVNSSLEATKILIDNGADLNEHGDGDVLAIHNATSDVLKYLILKGVDVNRIGAEACSPLMYEVYMHNYENIHILIENGADLNYQSAYDGYTSLHWAARKGDLKVVKLLVENGAKISTLNNEKQTPRDLAKENEYDNIYEYLLNLNNK